MIPAQAPIVLFDGVCNLCNAAVEFIITRDRDLVFRFGSLQSEQGRLLAGRCGIDPTEMTTMVLIEGETCYTQSTAVLRVAKRLPGWWAALYLFVLVPRPLRDLVYRWVSRRRYTWFGKGETCRVPTPEERSRFVE